MLPRSTAERVICTFCMMASGVVWTYAIGSVASIATTLSPNRVLYQNTMDQVNSSNNTAHPLLPSPDMPCVYVCVPHLYSHHNSSTIS